MHTDEKTVPLTEKIYAGKALAIAKSIRMIENEEEGFVDLLDSLYHKVGKAHRIGITGPPGAGKSTFVGQLTKIIRGAGLTVGIIAVDPASPYTGGVLFGDRFRMNDFYKDPGVFIRSVSSNNHAGGLTKKVSEIADVLDASNKDVVIFETAGVGQIELDISLVADTILVLTVPYAGDVIQSMKAGLMEIGDIFIVNKADLPGASNKKSDLEFVVGLNDTKSGWLQKVRLTDSLTGQGFEDVFRNIQEHLKHLEKAGLLPQKRNIRIEERVHQLISDRILDRYWTQNRLIRLKDVINESATKLSPYTITKNLMDAEENSGD